MTVRATRHRWTDIPETKMRGNITRRFMNSETLMLGLLTMRAGDVVPAHSHHNEQFTYVLSGKMKFMLGEAQDEILVIGAGEVIMLPGGIIHGAEILEDTVEIDVFSPPRADWIDGSDAYLLK